jgi:hypothetical protein
MYVELRQVASYTASQSNASLISHGTAFPCAQVTNTGRKVPI